MIPVPQKVGLQPDDNGGNGLNNQPLAAGIGDQIVNNAQGLYSLAHLIFYSFDNMKFKRNCVWNSVKKKREKITFFVVIA